MIHITFPARVQATVLALVLILPVATIPWQSRERLEQFHNRVLHRWPKPSVLLKDPPAFFKQISQWTSDRANPIIEASVFYKKVLFYALASPPQKRVTLGREGHVFVNGASEDSLNDMFVQTCVNGHSDATVSSLEQYLPVLARYGAQIKSPIYVVVVPTTATLYGDYLPRSVPAKYRTPCVARAGGDLPLRRLADRKDLNLVYPSVEMRQQRHDPGYYPRVNFHPTGLSLVTIRDGFLRKAGLEPKIEEAVRLSAWTSEILGMYDIQATYPVYYIYNGKIASDDAASARVNRRLSDLSGAPPLTAFYTNDSERASRTALILSDSFGGLASRVFAGAFRRLIWVYTNDIRQEMIGEVIARVAELEQLDVIIMLVNEGGVDRILTWAKALSSAKSLRLAQ